jgi:hypothetical protein
MTATCSPAAGIYRPRPVCLNDARVGGSRNQSFDASARGEQVQAPRIKAVNRLFISVGEYHSQESGDPLISSAKGHVLRKPLLGDGPAELLTCAAREAMGT